MYSYIKKSVTYLFLISLLIGFEFSNEVYAQYDVIKARTVDNENITEVNTDAEVSTFNDPDLPNFSQEDSVSSLLEKKISSFLDKRKSKKIKEDKDIVSEDINESGTAKGSVRAVDNEDEPVEEKNRFQINADEITYDDEEGNVYAKGHVEIIAKSQGVTLKADNAVLDKPSQTIKLTDNVKILKDGTEMSG